MLYVKQPDTIAVRGVNGDYCIISPREYSWGPYLAPRSTGLWDLPIQSNWGTGPFGQFFSSWKPKPRDVVWTVHVQNPDGREDIDQNSELWHVIWSRWRNMFSPQDEATIEYTSVDGTRTLGVRTLQAPQSLSSNNFEGGDPNQFAYGSIVQTMRAEIPFYIGPSQQFSWESPGSGDFWFPLPYYNPASVDIWSEWDLDGGATWILPDYSFGNEIHGRGLADTGKTFPVPLLLPGEGTTVMARPDMELMLSELETPVDNRNPGFNLDYPIPPGKGSPDDRGPNPGCIVRCIGAVSAGLGCVLTLPRWYAEPFGTPRIVASGLH